MEQTTVHTPDEAVEALRHSGARRIGVDGQAGAGKTTLARELGRERNLAVKELDSYVASNRGGFVDHLDYDELARELNLGGFVVEGACLLQVLDHLGLELDTLIYVKRMQHGLWCDEDVCDITEEQSRSVIEREQKTLEDFAQLSHDLDWDEQSDTPPKISRLTKELIIYHGRWRPHTMAQLVYEREAD